VWGSGTTPTTEFSETFQRAKTDEFVKSRSGPVFVIPAPYQVRGKLQPESRVPGENRGPVYEMVPDFRRNDVWTPVFTGVTDLGLFTRTSRLFPLPDVFLDSPNYRIHGLSVIVFDQVDSVIKNSQQHARRDLYAIQFPGQHDTPLGKRLPVVRARQG